MKKPYANLHRKKPARQLKWRIKWRMATRTITTTMLFKATICILLWNRISCHHIQGPKLNVKSRKKTEKRREEKRSAIKMRCHHWNRYHNRIWWHIIGNHWLYFSQTWWVFHTKALIILWNLLGWITTAEERKKKWSVLVCNAIHCSVCHR